MPYHITKLHDHVIIIYEKNLDKNHDLNTDYNIELNKINFNLSLKRYNDVAYDN